MSNATFSMGMKSYGNSPFVGGYKSWKSTTPPNEWKQGISLINIPPLTNNDSGNIFINAPFKPRPLKLYRRGRQFIHNTSGLPINVANNTNHYYPLSNTTNTTNINILTTFNQPGGLGVTRL